MANRIALAVLTTEYSCARKGNHVRTCSFLHQLTATIRVAAPFLFSKINAWRPVKRILVHKREKEIGDNVMRLIRGIQISAS